MCIEGVGVTILPHTPPNVSMLLYRQTEVLNNTFQLNAKTHGKDWLGAPKESWCGLTLRF